MLRTPSRFFFSIAVLQLLAGCAEHPIPVLNDNLDRTYFSRHVIRAKQTGDYKTIYRSNILAFPDVYPPGGSVEFKMYSSMRADLAIDGVPCRMYSADTPFPTNPAGIEDFLEKHFVDDRDKLQLDSLEKTHRDYIDAGTAAIGMTKEEVLMALGYPDQIDADIPAAPLSRERTLESNQWLYRHHKVMTFTVWWTYQFGPDGKLSQVIQ